MGAVRVDIAINAHWQVRIQIALGDKEGHTSPNMRILTLLCSQSRRCGLYVTGFYVRGRDDRKEKGNGGAVCHLEVFEPCVCVAPRNKHNGMRIHMRPVRANSPRGPEHADIGN